MRAAEALPHGVDSTPTPARPPVPARGTLYVWDRGLAEECEKALGEVVHEAERRRGERQRPPHEHEAGEGPTRPSSRFPRGGDAGARAPPPGRCTPVWAA